MSTKFFLLPYFVWILLSLTTVASTAEETSTSDPDPNDPHADQNECQVFRRHCKTCRDHEELCHRIADCDKQQQQSPSTTESPCKLENLQELQALCLACKNTKAECNRTAEKCKPILFPVPVFPQPQPEDKNCLQEKAPCSTDGKPTCCSNLICVKESTGDNFYCQQKCGRDGAKCNGPRDPFCCQGYSCEGSEGNYKCSLFFQVHVGQEDQSPGSQNCIQPKGKCQMSADGSDNCCKEGGYSCFCRTSVPFSFFPKKCNCEFAREEISSNSTPPSTSTNTKPKPT